MTSYTGTLKTLPRPQGDLFPLVSGWRNPDSIHAWQQRDVFYVQLDGVAAIGTDDYTYTIFKAPRAYTLIAAYLVDPTGLSSDAVNFNTFSLYNGATLLCQRDTGHGFPAMEPVEIVLAAAAANRALAEDDEVTLEIAGTADGRVINDGTWIFVVCEYA